MLFIFMPVPASSKPHGYLAVLPCHVISPPTRIYKRGLLEYTKGSGLNYYRVCKLPLPLCKGEQAVSYDPQVLPPADLLQRKNQARDGGHLRIPEMLHDMTYGKLVDHGIGIGPENDLAPGPLKSVLEGKPQTQMRDVVHCSACMP